MKTISTVAMLLLACSPVQAHARNQVCRDNDARTPVALWTPDVDENGNLSSEPPTEDGAIVLIQLHADAALVECNDGALNSFSLPNDPDDHMAGGLAVNIRGNTQFANGICYFRGYYLNEDVMGLHQGWVETYFGAVDRKDIALSNGFCLERSPD